MKVIKPPTTLDIPPGVPSVFLAGSIEMGTAIHWQKDVEDAFAKDNVTLFNPRRDDFDPTCKQVKEDPYFRGQVEWELNALDRSDLIMMYFAPTTKAPITLLELGLHARSGKVIICCPEPYWRKGNVDIVAERFNIPVVTTLEELISATKKRLAL